MHHHHYSRSLGGDRAPLKQPHKKTDKINNRLKHLFSNCSILIQKTRDRAGGCTTMTKSIISIIYNILIFDALRLTDYRCN